MAMTDIDEKELDSVISFHQVNRDKFRIEYLSFLGKYNKYFHQSDYDKAMRKKKAMGLENLTLIYLHKLKNSKLESSTLDSTNKTATTTES